MNSVLNHPTTTQAPGATTADILPGRFSPAGAVVYAPTVSGAVCEDAVAHTPAPARAGDYPIESAVRTVHGVSIIKTRWAGDHWEHRFPSHGNPGQHHITTRSSCSECKGFAFRGHCSHSDAVTGIEAQLHSDCWYALRYMRPSQSIEDYCYGLSLLARMGLSEDTARAVINAETAVA